MQCSKCGSKMYLDDKDFNFKGCYDNYWCCPTCKTSCIEEVRYGKPHRELWHTENNGLVVDWKVSRSLDKFRKLVYNTES